MVLNLSIKLISLTSSLAIQVVSLLPDWRSAVTPTDDSISSVFYYGKSNSASQSSKATSSYSIIIKYQKSPLEQSSTLGFISMGSLEE